MHSKDLSLIQAIEPQPVGRMETHLCPKTNTNTAESVESL